MNCRRDEAHVNLRHTYYSVTVQLKYSFYFEQEDRDIFALLILKK